MLLAEALAERAQAQERLNTLKDRLVATVRVQEGDEPDENPTDCLLYTSPSPRDRQKSRMPSSA